MREDGRKSTYYEVALIGLKPDVYRILKGPQDEIRLARCLRDDYNCGRYEKMVLLVAGAAIPKEYRRSFCSVFSVENIKEKFEEGNEKIEYSYLRMIEGVLYRFLIRAYPRSFGEQGGLEEFMLYVIQEEATAE